MGQWSGTPDSPVRCFYCRGHGASITDKYGADKVQVKGLHCLQRTVVQKYRQWHVLVRPAKIYPYAHNSFKLMRHTELLRMPTSFRSVRNYSGPRRRGSENIRPLATKKPRGLTGPRPSMMDHFFAYDRKKTFRDLELHPLLCRRLEDEGFVTPSNIQDRAIPAILNGTNTKVLRLLLFIIVDWILFLVDAIEGQRACGTCVHMLSFMSIVCGRWGDWQREDVGVCVAHHR